VPTFPQARYLFGRREWQHWKHLRDTGGYHHMDHLVDSIDPVMQAGLVEFIDPDFQITDEVSLIPTPGHTPGHVSCADRSAATRRDHGDLMHHRSSSRCRRRTAISMDKAQGAQTRVEFIDRFANRPALIIGSHFSDPSAGHIVSDGKGWKLVTE
jgi:glyoxylase-like metal-dependent hydrolase (beta-lactamase superfamily II)